MRYIKLLHLDLKRTMRENIENLLYPLVLGALFGAEMWRALCCIQESGVHQTIALGDMILYAYGGMEEYLPIPGNSFEFPTIWFLVLGLSAFSVLNWPVRDLEGTGQFVMVQTNKKSRWWLSKCAWNVCATLSFHMILFLIFCMLCVTRGYALSLDFHMEFHRFLFGLPPEYIDERGTELSLLAYFVPILFSIALNMLQMAMSLFLKPIYSYILVLSILLSSAYLLRPYMIGNYGMILRQDWLISNGVSIHTGILILLAIMIGSTLAGLWKIYHLDILKKE